MEFEWLLIEFSSLLDYPPQINVTFDFEKKRWSNHRMEGVYSISWFQLDNCVIKNICKVVGS